MELFDARGIADLIIRRVREINPHPFQASHIWGGLRPVDWRSRGGRGQNWTSSDSRFPFTSFVPQNETEMILRGWAQQQGADLQLGLGVARLQDQGSHVVVTVEDTEGTEQVLTARYVVGADGNSGPTRTLAGIESDEREPTLTTFLVNLDVAFPWPDPLHVGHNEHGWVACFPFGKEVTRMIVTHAESREKARHEPVTVEEVRRCATDVLGETPNFTSVVSWSRYDDTQRIAHQFRKGNIFLVGESARVHYPASGIGMNWCLQDAFNVGWKLAAVLNGHADESLLDTYEQERRPVSLDLLRTVDAQTTLQFNFSGGGVTLQNYVEELLMPLPEVTGLLQMDLNGLCRPYPTEPDAHRLAGNPVPDVDLYLYDGSTSRLYELLRDQDFVLLDLSGTGALGALEFTGLPIRIVDAYPARIPDRLANVTALLVRPDAYVAWATEGRPDAAAAASQVKRWLRMP